MVIYVENPKESTKKSSSNSEWLIKVSFYMTNIQNKQYHLELYTQNIMTKI